MSIKLSVIVPVYNCEKYVAECLRSILGQKCNSYEIICVNDGSTDLSLSIIKKFEQENSDKVKVISQENKGLSAARNAGIKASSGKYVWFVDSDDKISNQDVINRMIREMELNALDVLYFELDGYYENEDIKKIRQPIVEDLKLGREYGLYEKGYDFFCELQQESKRVICAVCSCVRKDMLEKNKIAFIEGHTHEDVLYNFQLMLSASRVKHINEVFYLYNQHGGGSISSNVDFSHIISLHVVLNEMMLFSISHKWPEYVESMIIRRIDQFNNYINWLMDSINIHELNQCQYYFLENAKSKKIRQDKVYVFPVYLFPKNAQILIYGAGKVGMKFIRFLKDYDELKLAGVVDRNKKGQVVGGICISGIEDISALKFDYILIAIEKEDVARQVKGLLQSLGVKEGCIKWAGELYEEKNFLRWIYSIISKV